MEIEMTRIDLKTGIKTEWLADVQQEPDETHPIYSLTYDGYRTPWVQKELWEVLK